jgi:hypothetical protein
MAAAPSAFQNPACYLCPSRDGAEGEMAANVIEDVTQRGNNDTVQMGHGHLQTNILRSKFRSVLFANGQTKEKLIRNFSKNVPPLERSGSAT